MKRLEYLLAAIVVLFSLAPMTYAEQNREMNFGPPSPGSRNQCTLAGTWYGGSVVSYLMTVTPAASPGEYIAVFQGMYRNSVINTSYTALLKQNKNRYEGGGMSLTTQDSDFLNLPPIGKLPDLLVGWFSMEQTDCNTIMNTIPFLGLYQGKPDSSSTGIWQPGTPWSGIDWIPNGKVPLVDPPDVNMIPLLSGDTKPLVETYHRLPARINPHLLQQ